MRVYRLERFTGGWLIGDFEPTLHRQKGVEVAVKHYEPGDVDKAHVHRVATEITCVVSGCAIMRNALLGDVTLRRGDVLVLDPGDKMPGDWEVLEPTDTVCIKFPSAPGDKYPVPASPSSSPV